MSLTIKKKITNLVNKNSCIGCGLCVALDESNCSKMLFSRNGPQPDFFPHESISELAWHACPGKGINYIELYNHFFSELPDNWLLGHYESVRVGFSADTAIRRQAASGGVLTTTLIYLLENNYIDAAILPRQLDSDPVLARPAIMKTKKEILSSSQSIYTPIPMLEILSKLDGEKCYAITCTPEQAAAVRYLQMKQHPKAQAIKFVLGPYTGTALYPEAVSSFLKAHRVKPTDKIEKLKWRAGEWPGYLEIQLASGRIIRAEKFYYNYLIPFFITQSSLQSMNFTNEFCDLSVGDAWSPRYEKQRQGFSVFTTRTAHMEKIMRRMIDNSVISAQEVDPIESLNMHGHMLDFKKRGGYIRNTLRKRFCGVNVDYGISPTAIGFSRVFIELIVISIFTICRLPVSRKLVGWIPESLLSSLFDALRKGWKFISKPTKRKNLYTLKMNPKAPAHE